MREMHVGQDELAGRTVGVDRRRRRPRAGHPLVLLGALAMVASACITTGSWTSTAPAAVGIPGTYRPQFVGLSCPTTSFCMATGGGSPYQAGSDLYTPVVQTWDGSSWTDRSADFPLLGSEGTSVASVSCASATSCLATYLQWVPLDIYTGVAHWDGSSWQLIPVDNFFSHTTALACEPGGTCLIVAEGASTYRWDGDSVEEIQGVTAPELSALDCTSATACWGIDGAGNQAWRWNGATWTSVWMPTPPGDPALYPTFYGASIDCSTPSWCVAVGQINIGITPAPAAALWDGSAWTYPPVPHHAPGAYRSVSCVNGAECVALGATLINDFPFYDQPLTAVWNVKTWFAAPNPPGTGPLYPAVSCPMGNDLACTAVGGSPNDPNSVLVAARYTWTHSP
jgi:hypothetical protein